jgi:hypothetical protein
MESAKVFQPVSRVQVREVLHSRSWQAFGNEDLVLLLDASIILYGSEINQEDIQLIGELYVFVVKAGVDVQSRVAIEDHILGLVEKEGLSPVAFLPFLVKDPDEGLVSKTTIDFVGASPYSGSELYALTELRPLIKNRILENRAAAFGALVSMGDTELLPLIAELRPELSWEEVQRAALVQTSFLQHHAIQFWLTWAKELSGREDAEASANFGSCASALMRCLRYTRVQKVFDGKRHFPCAAYKNPITIRQSWSRSDYADLLAQDFYDLERLESTPKIFSHVLRSWGLRPRAPLEQQFIPDHESPDDDFHLLRDPLADPPERH